MDRHTFTPFLKQLKGDETDFNMRKYSFDFTGTVRATDNRKHLMIKANI